MRIALEALPSTLDFFLDYVRCSDKVRRFYPHDHSLEAVAQFASECARIDPDQRASLVSALESQQERWGADTGSLDKLRSGGVVVIAGQQAGLFTGPMYSVLKALTAVKLARNLDKRGIAAVPVFWIASEDHDHAEIEWACILSKDSVLRKITTELADGVRTPVGWLRFRSAIQETIEECFRVLPSSEFQNDVRSLVEETYCPDASPVDAFARMMARLFKGTELILADPLDPALRSLSEPALDTAARRVGDIRSAVLERSRLISEAGYAAQVRVDKNFTGLFAYRGRSREPLRPGEEVPSSDLSPNVLLRPFVQDSLFPTAAYVGGPAEIAYFAQVGSIYECLGKLMPPVFPRITATLVEPPVTRVLKKYGFSVEDVFQGADRLKERAVGSIQGAELFDEVRTRVSEEAERLRPILEGVDRTLTGALDNSVQKMRHQIDTLQSRFVNAESRGGEILERQLNTLTNRLYPDRKLQERVLNVTSFLVRYGLNLVPMMDERLDLDGSVHQVIEL